MNQSTSSSTAPASSFRLGRVLLIVIPLGLAAFGGIYCWGYFDVPTLLANMGRPKLVAAKGKVMFAGEPLSRGQIETEHENPKLRGAVGFLGEDGNFLLQVDIDGNFVNGAVPGKHKVRVFKADPTARPGMSGAAPLMTPDQYASFDTTPIEIVVDADPTKNKFDIVLEGEPRYVNPELLKPVTELPKPKEVDPEVLAQRVNSLLERVDTDSDGKITPEEIEKLQGFEKSSMQMSDTNKDGVVDRTEVEGAVKRLMQSFGGGGGGGAKPKGKGKFNKRPPTEDEPADTPQEKPSDKPADAPASEP